MGTRKSGLKKVPSEMAFHSAFWKAMSWVRPFISPVPPADTVAADGRGAQTRRTLAVRRGESEHKRQLRLERQPEDENQGEGPEGGA